MSRLYLLTGFLGAGKTTLLQNLLRIFSDQTCQVIINEFGKTGVDAALLEGVRATLREVNNGSIFCACRQQEFETALWNAANENPEVILVEASGLSDPGGVCRLMQDPRFASIDYRGSICLVDATRFEKVVQTARPVARQLSVSSLILINKADLVSSDALEALVRRLSADYPGAALHTTEFAAVAPEWLEALSPFPGADETLWHRPDITQQKAWIRLRPTMTRAQLEHFLQLFAEDTYRVKGLVSLSDGDYLVDCVGALVRVTPFQGTLGERENQLVALAGAGLPLRRSLKAAAAWYPEWIEEIQYP